MLRALTLVATAVLVAAGGADTASTGGTAVAFVALPGASALAIVDVGSGNVTGRVRVPGGPEEVTAYHDIARGRPFLVVTSPREGTVTLVDALERRVVKVWRGFGEPADVVVEGTRAYVTDARRGELVVLALGNRRVISRIAVGPRPHAVAVGDVAVVAHERRTSLTLVDIARKNVIARIPVGGVVQSISKRPDTADVFVTYRGTGAVARIDWGTRRVVFRRTVAQRASDVVTDVYAGDRAWVADEAGGRLRLIASRDGRVRRTLAGCPGARRIVQVGTARVVATCVGNASLAIWDTSRWRYRATPLGAAPAGVAVAILP